MTIYLRQSTASQEVPLGYFVDSTDGDTAMTGLTIANTDIKIHKTGATTLANKNSGGATHISGGVYYAVLDATDTDTIGPLTIFIHVSGALAVRVACVVLDEAVYDAMFGTVALATATNITAGTITTATNVTTVNGLAANVITAASIATGAIDADAIADNAIDAGAIASGAITNAKFAAGAIDATAIANGAIDAATFATGAIDAAALAADAGTEIGTAVWATAARTLTALDEDSTTLDLDATIRSAVGLAAANLDTQLGDLPTNAELTTALGTADDAVLSAIAGLNNLSSAQAQTAAAAALTAYDPPTKTELDNAVAPLALEATLATVDGIATAIKAKTDSLTFTQAGQVDSNIQYVNDVELVGDGSATPFNVA